jgi:hypothetical protein
MMGAQTGKQQRGSPLGVRDSTALLGISAAVLIALDLLRFSVATGVGALALAAFVAAYVVRPGPRLGIYAFLIAEVSAISLGANLSTALLYQAFAVLLLTAVIVPYPRVAKLSVYGKPALMTALIAVASLTPGVALVYSNWLGLTALQAGSLSGAILLVLAVVLIFVRPNTTLLSSVPNA